MNEERGYALPKLYGAPAYARPPAQPVAPVERPFDPDDLPLEAERTHEEQELLRRLQPHPYERVAKPGPATANGSGKLTGRSFGLRLPGRGRSGR